MDMTRRDLMFGALGAAMLTPGMAAAETVSVGGAAFGSSWRATVVTMPDAEALQRIVQSVIADIDARFSPYRADSGLSRFNAARTSKWQPIHPMFATVVREALDLAAQTRGYFDPTVGPLVARQGFGPIKGRAATLPEIEIRDQRLRKSHPEATLDLCGIAKGYALDQVTQALAEAGLARALVEIGGEVRALGSHPDGRPWKVAIADPNRPGTARCVMELKGLALATSGHAVHGVRGRASTSHIIDPHRRRPASQVLRSVSVLDRSAMRADAFATALCAAGPDAGPVLAQHLGLRALFIMDGADSMTGGFETHILT